MMETFKQWAVGGMIGLVLGLGSPVAWAQSADELDALMGDDDSTQTEEMVSEESDELDSLEGLGDDSGNSSEEDDLGGLGNLGESDESSEESFDDFADESSDESEADEPPISFGGYVKPLAYWQKINYSDETREGFQAYADRGYTMPTEREDSGYTDLGARYQLKLEGFLGDTARFFSAVNLDQNEAADDENSPAELNVVEAYAEIFEGSRTWKIGSQLVTWGYMEGVEVPTDRINARDFSYNSTEFEDSKMASTGILLQQSLGDFSGLEIMLIPEGKRHVNSPMSDLFFPESAQEEKMPKSAIRYFTTLGDLDLALSYVEGADPISDFETDADGFNRRAYHREKSPGLDLQYNFGAFLGKLAYAAHLTEDEDNDDPMVKNHWQHWAAGIEVMQGGATVNLYVGQRLVEDHSNETPMDQANNFLLDQAQERVDFLSGHINANFLTGDALGTTVIFAGYWDEDGESLQKLIKPTLNYKIADGLLATFSPAYVDLNGTTLESVQAEVKYSF